MFLIKISRRLDHISKNTIRSTKRNEILRRDVPIPGWFIITKSVIFDSETAELFQAELREEGSMSLFL